MTGFQIGDEVVCVDDAFHSDWCAPALLYNAWDHPVTAGKHYIVEDVEFDEEEQQWRVTLCGVRVGLRDGGLCHSRFRKIKPESIQLFRAMCVSNKPLVRVG